MNTLFGILIVLMCVIAPAFGAGSAITYSVGAWPYQSGLVVKNMHVDTTNIHLSPLSDIAVVTIRISGTATFPQGGWRPEVVQAHVSERFVPSATDPKRVVEVEITPIIDVKEDNDYKGRALPYSLSFSYTLHTYDWGVNRFRVVVLDKEQRFDIQKSK
jgi:hypothetical protein